MKLFCVCWALLMGLLSAVFSRNLPVLDPQDPQFAWMDSVIEQDFSGYKRKINWGDYARSLQGHTGNEWIVRFQVINNQVKGPDCECLRLLEYLCRIYGLPDLDFLYWNQDGPDRTLPGTVPVLTGIRRKGAKNTVLFGNVYIFDIANPNGPWMGDIEVIDKNSLPWSERENKLFWRGAATDVWIEGSYSVDNWSKHVRGGAVALSMQRPDYIDAAFTTFYSFLTEEGRVGVEKLQKIVPLAERTSLCEHLKYKYQFQAMGIIGNFPRDVWQLYSESVSFRHPYIDEVYWSHLLKPWEHYIPIEISLSDLIEKIDWARDHDAECYEMAKRTRSFAEGHLMPEHIALYCYKALVRYARLQGFDPRCCPFSNKN